MVNVTMLPGLGKSRLSEDNTNVLDLEDFVGADKYKTLTKGEYISARSKADANGILFFLSSKWHEDFDGRTDIFIGATEGSYNRENLIKRGREDLAELYDDVKLEKWANDYRKFEESAGNAYQDIDVIYLDLNKEEFVTINDLINV